MESRLPFGGTGAKLSARIEFPAEQTVVQMKSKSGPLNSTTRLTKEPKLSRNYAPANLSPVDWQRGLRRQFGREQAFGLENLGSEPFFSEFRVSNPVSKSSYRVAIRGPGPGSPRDSLI